MKIKDKQRVIIINLLIAAAISLIVNFSLLALSLTPTQEPQSREMRQGPPPVESQRNGAWSGEGRRGPRESQPQDQSQAQTEPGDQAQQERPEGSRLEGRSVRLNPTPDMPRGREMRYTHASAPRYLLIRAAFWFAMAFVLLTLSTHIRKDGMPRNFGLKVLYCCAAALIIYMFEPVSNREGNIIMRINSTYFSSSIYRLFFDISFFRLAITLSVALLYGKIFELVYQKQGIVIENERLKTENLQSRYNMLVSQINPHFFFNSLNSLAMLVRSNENGKALTYIDRLSDTFRFIIQKGQNDMITLGEELEFLEGYKYVHEVRYADKLFFDIDIDTDSLGKMLPALSLQPLIENAVKHNSITLSKPFRISIRTEGDFLLVSNPIIPKIEKENGTGIGLKNLASRYELLTGKDITIDESDGRFTVRLPLTKSVQA